MAKDIEEFCKSCLHCCANSPVGSVPRPLGHALHATKPNELIHFDFCYMGRGEGGNVYAIIVKDDLSGYIWLRPCEAADSETTAQVLLEWFSAFGTVYKWTSDQGSHFKNELVRNLGNMLKCNHHFTLPYCPWTNGTVEVVCRELLRVARSLLSEFQLPPSAWPSILCLDQSALNSAPSKKLNGQCPLTVFTGLPSDSPILAIVRQEDGAHIVKDIELAKANALIDIEKTRIALDQMHRECASHSSKRRKNTVDAHNRRTGVKQINFDVGDFVLKGLLQRQVGPKTALRWRGPYRVTKSKENYIFEIEDLLTGKKEQVHVRRLKFFQNKSYQITEDLQELLEYQRDELLVVDSFDDIRKQRSEVQVLVNWRGFEGERDWVSYSSLQEDVPELLAEFIYDIREAGTPRQKSIANNL